MKNQDIKELRQARPTIYTVSPLRYWLIIGFILFNIGIATTLWRQYNAYQTLVIYNDLLSTRFYATIFAGVSLFEMIGLKTNNWRMIKRALLVGLFIQSTYTYALIDIGFKVGIDGILGVICIWLLIMWVKFFLFVYFSPDMNGRTVAKIKNDRL